MNCYKVAWSEDPSKRLVNPDIWEYEEYEEYEVYAKNEEDAVRKVLSEQYPYTVEAKHAYTYNPVTQEIRHFKVRPFVDFSVTSEEV